MSIFGTSLPVGKVTKAIQRGRDQAVKNVKEGSQVVQKDYGKGRDSLMEGKGQALDYLSAGAQDAAPYLQQAQGLYSGLAPGDLSARAMYLNSLGLNGPEGNTAATNTFQNSPGFQFALDQANQNVLRNGAATGNVASGNVLQALADRAQGLQNQDYGNWQDRLSNQGNNIYQDYSGQANALGSLSNLFSSLGSNRANVATGTASQLNNSWQGQGGLLNNNNLQLANINADRATALGNLSLQQAANQNAQQQALWGGVLGLGGDLLGAAGKAGSFGSLFG